MPRAEHFARLAAAGYTTVLDVSAPEEARGYDEAAVAAQAGLTYVNIPVRSYQPEDTTFDAVRTLLRDPSRRPLLFHCRSANRVGGLLLPYLILDEGRGQEEALNLAIQVGLRSQDLALAALTYVNRQGGAAGRA
jgi:protein tyrosine phosphatase (PTP) superfamily phosphohydrolase (DUF442 family)